MFDYFKIISFIFSGKLDEAPNHVSKYVFAYCIIHIVTQFLLLIDAFAGLKYYERILYFLPGNGPIVIAGIGATIIAFSLYFLQQGTGSSIADYAEGRRDETQGKLFGFIVSVILLLGFIYISVHANLEGVKVPIEMTIEGSTQSIADITTEVNSIYDPKINRIQGKQDSLRRGHFGYGWYDKKDKKYRLNPSGTKLDKTYTQQIQDLREESKTLIAERKTETTTKNSKAAEIGDMALQNLHGMIFVIIPLTMLMSIFAASVANRVFDYVATLDNDDEDLVLVSDLKVNNLPSYLTGNFPRENAGLNRRSNRSDYSENRLRIKTIIQENPGISQKQIVEITGLSPRTVGAHVRALKQEGII